MLLALKMEEEVTEQGMSAASRRWKKQRNGCSSRASRKKHSPVDTLILSQ